MPRGDVLFYCLPYTRHWYTDTAMLSWYNDGVACFSQSKTRGFPREDGNHVPTGSLTLKTTWLYAMVSYNITGNSCIYNPGDRLDRNTYDFLTAVLLMLLMLADASGRWHLCFWWHVWRLISTKVL